jgi:hypothetical protein
MIKRSHRAPNCARSATTAQWALRSLEGERCDCPDKETIEPSMLVNVPQLVTAYFTGKPDPTVPSQ